MAMRLVKSRHCYIVQLRLCFWRRYDSPHRMSGSVATAAYGDTSDDDEVEVQPVTAEVMTIAAAKKSVPKQSNDGIAKGFFSLPGELRNLIFSFLCRDCDESFRRATSSLSEHETAVLDARSQRDQHTVLYSPANMQVFRSLSRVCKQLRQESRSFVASKELLAYFIDGAAFEQWSHQSRSWMLDYITEFNVGIDIELRGWHWSRYNAKEREHHVPKESLHAHHAVLRVHYDGRPDPIPNTERVVAWFWYDLGRPNDRLLDIHATFIECIGEEFAKLLSQPSALDATQFLCLVACLRESDVELWPIYWNTQPSRAEIAKRRNTFLIVESVGARKMLSILCDSANPAEAFNSSAWRKQDRTILWEKRYD